MSEFKFKEVFNITVIVAALGYFVDVYDLVLFLIIGIPSLKDLLPGIAGNQEALIENFQYLLNVQMIGMLIGGIFWGILGDKKGRLSVLFGSIIMYSLANIANGLVAHLNADPETTMKTYAVLRLIAGIGLAGELGAGITLVSEIMSKETRGYGTMIIASFGVTGAVAAGFIGKLIGWETTYYIGGGLGVSLLLLRIGVFESGIFKNLTETKVRRGNFLLLFSDKKRALKYLQCILVGLPVWYIIGILVGRAPVLAGILGVKGVVEQEVCVILCYTGLIFGDIASGVISQLLKSRKKVFFIFYTLACIFIGIYLRMQSVSSFAFYSMVMLLGFSVGFWAILVTVGSEQFGTNIRATAATTVPNFVRGSLVPISILFQSLYDTFKASDSAFHPMVLTAGVVTLIVMLISYAALFFLPETFGKDLDYVEEENIDHE